jgi:hypothetical protein
MDPTRWPHAPYARAVAQQEPTDLDEGQGAGGWGGRDFYPLSLRRVDLSARPGSPPR